MFIFTNEEYYDMLIIYGECRQNARAAQAMYTTRFPHRRQPGKNTFIRAANTLRELGHFPNGKCENRRKTATNEANKIGVLASVAYNPHMSVRSIAQDSAISVGSVHKILKTNNYKPYKIHLVHGLYDGDDIRRLNFIADDFMELYSRIPNFLARILWSDESNFSNNGIVNRHNSHYWSSENPYWIRERNFQRRWSVNVWCGILGDQLIGPYFFNGTLTGQQYLDFLMNQLPLLLENINLSLRQVMYFQQDGAPAHNSNIVSAHLNRVFPRRWIGTNGPIRWPARSPDLTTLDFFLWGHLKSVVYDTPSRNIEELTERIRTACASIAPGTLRNVTSTALMRRYQKCVECDGGTFDHIN